jgi:hypothetical protein
MSRPTRSPRPLPSPIIKIVLLLLTTAVVFALSLSINYFVKDVLDLHLSVRLDSVIDLSCLSGRP